MRQEERRLAAVLALDVVGYSRLMAADEVGTLAQIKTHRKELIDPKAEEHHGRTVKLMGDGALMEFASVVDAVNFAAEVQRAMAGRNAAVPEDRRVVYRIGINLGDVMVDGDDIFGDGVNIAARLETLAAPGGVSVSQTVVNHVAGKVPWGFEDLGTCEVKNIPKPVHVFRLRLEGPVAGPIAAQRGGRRRVVAALVVAAAAAVIAGLWLRPWEVLRQPAVEPAMIENMAMPLPDRPSIAVLPFANISDDPAQAYFADGITEDLITDLSKVSGLFVIARNSVFAYKGRPVKIREVAEELGVRYVLEGSVRRAGDQVRINAQLIDATTGGHLWAERYDGALGDVFGLQDEVARQIVGMLAVQLTQGEEARLVQVETQSSDAYDAFLQGWQQYQQQTPDGLKAAVGHFQRAIELDPDYARARAAIAATYWQVFRRFWHAEFGYRSVHGARAEAEKLLLRAQRQPTALGHQVATAMLSLQGRHTEALAEGGKAIGIDPNDADSYVALAGALSLAGNPDQALKLIGKAMRLNPHYPPYYLYELGLAEFGAGNYAAAVEALEQAAERNPQDRWSGRLLIAAYGHLGRMQDAERLLQIFSRNPRGYDPLTVRAVAYWYPYKEAVDRERLAAGLIAANVPD
ncbi:MAG TPA: adenylate/guanylate cyclase domain-containing protein [Thermohalobaculum sp.]|nr:adenylate/guanylate cyclase domain-containing protein [Thermohalobaculum sp.]